MGARPLVAGQFSVRRSFHLFQLCCWWGHARIAVDRGTPLWKPRRQVTRQMAFGFYWEPSADTIPQVTDCSSTRDYPDVAGSPRIL